MKMVNYTLFALLALSQISTTAATVECIQGENGSGHTPTEKGTNCEYCSNGFVIMGMGDDDYLGLKKCMSKAVIPLYQKDPSLRPPEGKCFDAKDAALADIFTEDFLSDYMYLCFCNDKDECLMNTCNGPKCPYPKPAAVAEEAEDKKPNFLE